MLARERAPKRLPCAAFFGYFLVRAQESDTSPFANSSINCNLKWGGKKKHRKSGAFLCYRSTPRNFFARMPTMKDSTATEMLMTAISVKRRLKGWSCAMLV